MCMNQIAFEQTSLDSLRLVIYRRWNDMIMFYCVAYWLTDRSHDISYF
jgi:hypothetical protein